jgi:hypothetical protein
MPNVDNESDPSLCPIVPRLVLKRIIKRHRLACHNVARIIGDAQSRTICAHQRQMQPQLLVCGTMAVTARSEPHYAVTHMPDSHVSA